MKENTIILLKGEATLTKGERKNFEKLDTISGNNSNSIEIKRWGIEDKDNALEELKKYKSTYVKSNQLYYIEEYALEIFEADEDGEFIEGSDYYPAPEEEGEGW